MSIYYVYAYIRLRADEHGPAGSPNYIGMGKRNRITSAHPHLRQPTRGWFILLAASGLSRQQAFDYERALIWAYGRADLQSGCLLNQTDGGPGSANPSAALKSKINPGRPHTDEAKKKCSEAAKRYWANVTPEQRSEANRKRASTRKRKRQ